MLHLRDIFYLSKSDRKAVIALLTGTVIAILLINRCGIRETGDTEDTTPLTDTLTQQSDNRQSMPTASEETAIGYPQGPTAERFAFDPNTADSTQLRRLGLRPWQVRNIYKYRAKGGVYRKKEDFARLYGLTVKQYRELEPYIRISDDYRPAAEVIGNATPTETAPTDRTTATAHDLSPQPSEATEGNHWQRTPDKLSYGQTVSLAHADTTLLQRVPGIGPYYARRIVEYRERLGGFYDVHQLLEIDGFPEEALDYMDIGTTEISRLNVNRLTLAQLRRHPYISYYQAKAIIDFRRLYGPLTDISQLALHKDFTDDDIRRLSHYLAYE